MTAGLRNRRVQLEQLAADPEAPPDPLAPKLMPRKFVLRFERWASMRAETQRESAQGGALVGSGLWRVWLRHDPETESVRAEDWRLRLGDQVFNIRAAYDPDGLRREILLRVEHGVAT